ncbi:MAG: histone family protein nucleoid-structuring protein H-NS family protein [Achromobacter sp.]|uniref:H-NS family nucleoid-associated regulatory protein n=1 Tax=Achromobacter sp. TaxID=134375 RepID=UPI0012C14709|nr:H-NS family nucleoid-associated regulatory protein [Achromobacter sp.]MPS81755.1 histone family protein nucleoid-structuring protein H-NS family protein [Achromobacter sp.]
MATKTRPLSLEKVDKELAQLNAQRAKLIQTQQDAILHQIRMYVAKALECGISPKQLAEEVGAITRKKSQAADGKPRRGRRPLGITKGMRQSLSKRPVPMKYVSPEGQEWSGLGRAPAWIAPYEKEDRKQFLIANPPSTTAADS